MSFSGARIWAGVFAVMRRQWLGLAIILALSVVWGVVAPTTIEAATQPLAPISQRLPWAINWGVHGIRDGVELGWIMALSLLAVATPLRDLTLAALRPLAAMTFLALAFHAPDIALDLIPRDELMQSAPALASFMLFAIGILGWLAKASIFAGLGLAPAISVATRAPLGRAIADGWRLSREVWWRLAQTGLVIEIAANLPGFLLPFSGAALTSPAAMIQRVVFSAAYTLQLLLAAQFYLEAQRLQSGAGPEPVDEVFG